MKKRYSSILKSEADENVYLNFILLILFFVSIYENWISTINVMRNQNSNEK